MSANPTGAQASFRFGDVCSGKHGGNPESKAANFRAEPHKFSLRQRVYSRIVLGGRYGRTCKEIALEEGRPMHAISGRISELKAMGEIQESTRTREGGRVLVASYLVKGAAQ